MKQKYPAPEKWALAVIVCLGVILTSAVSQAAAKTLIDPVVVTVNGEKITETEFLYFLMGKYGDDVTDQLIQHTYLAQEAGTFGLSINPQDGWDYMNDRYTEEKLDSLAAAFDLDQIAYALAREVTALEVLSAKGDQLIDELGITVTENDILELYLKLVDDLSKPESARIAWIICEDRSAADAAKARLDGGEDFGDVAADVSIDAETDGRDGEIGWIFKGLTAGFPKVLEDAVFGLDVEDYSDVLSVGENYFIIKVLEKRDAEEPSFEELKPAIEEQLLAMAIEAPLKAWVIALGEAAEIEVIYPIFQEMAAEGGMVPDSN